MIDADFHRPDSEEPMPTLDHVTVEHDEDPDECAIFPDDASEAELMTTWISAHGDAFVDLESIR